MKVLNKLIAILLGLALIGLVALAVVSTTGLKEVLNLDLRYEYFSSLPSWISWGNLALVILVAVLKVIVVLLMMFGRKKAARGAIFPLILIIADYFYRYRGIILDAYRTIFASFVFSDIINAIKNYGLDNLLQVGAFGAIGLFFLFFFIVAVAGKTHKIGVRITLLILGLLPAGLIYGIYVLDKQYLPPTEDLALFGLDFGLYLLMGFVICITHFDKDKVTRKRKPRVKGFDYPRLPMGKLTK